MPALVRSTMKLLVEAAIVDHRAVEGVFAYNGYSYSTRRSRRI